MAPLLWKKAKTGKIARLVCDLRRKRSRSPLVVQTGFPTSLADIVIKNSSRLKKPPPTKNAASDPSSSSTASTDYQGQIPDSVPCDDGRRHVEAGEPSTAPPVHAGDAEEAESIGNASVTGPACFTAIAKVFIVVMLALGTKQLAVAITASAIVLFLLEFIGKRWFFPPKPTDVAPLALDAGVRSRRDGEEARKKFISSSSINRQRSLEFPGTELERKHSGVRCTDRSVSLKKVAHREGKIRTEIHREGSTEIQASECDSGLHRNRSLELTPLECKSKGEASPSKDDPHLAGGKNKKTEKIGNKKFMEKFLKKLRRKKKHGKCHKTASDDIPICKGEEECEEEEEPDDEDEIFSSESSCNEVLDDDEEEEEEEDVSEESIFRKIPWNTGHLAFLAIVLLGLIGGRGVALTLSISSFVVLKAVQTIGGRLKMSTTNNQPCG
ncbi:hypothetical protein ACLOJK_021610 [Asimina triloba]